MTYDEYVNASTGKIEIGASPPPSRSSNQDSLQPATSVTQGLTPSDASGATTTEKLTEPSNQMTTFEKDVEKASVAVVNS